MAKLSYSDAEDAFENAMKQLQIDQLQEQARNLSSPQNGEQRAPEELITEVITLFQEELIKLKKEDLDLYNKLELTDLEEKKLLIPASQFLPEDWILLKKFREKVDLLKKNLSESPKTPEEFEKQISDERRKHINKRFNTRDGWLPLH